MPSKDYVGHTVAKKFPGFGNKKFKGTVKKCDNSDDRPFLINYEDGDSEWIGLAELKSILVSPPPEPSAKRAKTEAEAPASKGKGAAAATQHESKGRDKAHKTPGASVGGASIGAGAGAGPSTKPRATAAAAPAAAPAGSKGAGAGASKGPGAGTSKAAAAAEPSSARKDKSGARTASADNTGSALNRIVNTANGAAQQLQDGDIARMPFPEGVDMGGVRAVSQVVVAGNCVYITAVPRLGERRAGVDVQIQGVLTQLAKCLSTAGTRKERLLTVRVTLKQMSNGIGPFQSQWAAFASSKDVRPTMAILEAGGPYPDVQIVIEAVAAVAPTAE